MSRDARQDPRFQVTDANSVTVLAQRKSADEGPDISGVLLDLSCGGLRLRVESILSKGEQIRLVISASQFESSIHADATVRWVEPESGGQWIIGCDLKHRLAQDSINEMATVGTLERRNGARRPISITADAKTELEPGFRPVQIVDISDGGFRALAAELVAKQNDRLLVRIKSDDGNDGSLIRARVAWINELEDGKTMGCLFLTKADHSQMHAISRVETVDEPALIKTRFTTWSMVGAAVLVIIFVQFFLLKS